MSDHSSGIFKGVLFIAGIGFVAGVVVTGLICLAL